MEIPLFFFFFCKKGVFLQPIFRVYRVILKAGNAQGTTLSGQ